MKQLLLILILGLNAIVYSQQLVKEWARNYGGTNSERGIKLLETTDGNYMMLSTVGSYDVDVDTTHGSFDVWLTKLNTAGDIIWEKAFGGNGTENAISICHAHDSGYVVVASTTSYDGDVIGYHGGGWEDIWVFKCDLNGNLQWQKCLGGSLGEEAGNIIQTNDNSYIIVGSSNSVNGDISSNIGQGDCWIVKLDLLGNILWDTSIGGSDWESATDIIELPNKGFFIVGYTSSIDGHASQIIGDIDFWLVKLDSLGQYEWDKSYGTIYSDEVRGVIERSDNSYMLYGTTITPNGLATGDVTQPKGGSDVWIVQIDSLGNLLSENSYGGSSHEIGSALTPNPSGGYVLFASTISDDGDVTTPVGYVDHWIVQLDDTFNILTEKCFGSPFTDGVSSGIVTSDGSIFSIGHASSTGGDILNNYGYEDVWLLKVQSNVGLEEWEADTHAFSIYPNPAQDVQTIQFSALAHAEVSMELTDAQGRSLGTVYKGLTQEYNEIELRVEELESGVYFYRVQIGENWETLKFIKK